MSNKFDADATRAILIEEREKVARQLRELGATDTGDLRSDVDLGESFADAAAITADRTERLGLVESLKEAMTNITEALGRVDDGTYGYCLNCGKEIGAARLEVRPAARLCVDCKSKL